jgi:alanine racemase
MLATPDSVPSRVVLDIDLTTLRDNHRRIAAAVAPAGVIAVLKANAYGLGMRPIAGALAESGIAAIAVAELREALEALDTRVPVLLLGTVLPDEVEPCVASGIRIPIPDLATARLASAAAQRVGRPAIVHLAVDTGMGRLGLLADDASAAAREVARLPGLVLEGVYSHFPMAYRSASDFTLRQVERFKDLLADCECAGIRFAWRHIANSDAINNFPITAQPPFTHVRTGINLHGSFDIEGRRALQLRSVLTLRARLAQVRTLPAGSTVGYGATYTCPCAMRVGTVAAGYADGLPLALSNRGHLLIRGRPCPVLGRVSMDYATVALDQAPDAVAGDEVVCLGGEGPGSVSVEDWATLKGTHPYEVICSIGSRVQRRYSSSSASAS